METFLRSIAPSCAYWGRDGLPFIEQLCAFSAYPWVVAAWYLIMGLVVLTTLVAVLGFAHATGPVLPAAFISVFLLFFISFAWWSSQTWTLHAAEWLRMMSSPWFVLPALLAAGMLYKLRQMNLALYGLVEIIVGTTTLFAATLSAATASDVSTALLAKLLAVVAGIYIVVRGLDNMQKGAEKPKLERGESRSSRRSRAVDGAALTGNAPMSATQPRRRGTMPGQDHT